MMRNKGISASELGNCPKIERFGVDGVDVFRDSASIQARTACRAGRTRWWKPGLLSLLGLVALVLSGCASFNPKLGTISVTDPNPPNEALTSVVVSGAANVSITVLGDKPNLGVDWLLSCGGSPNPALESNSVACGSLNPAHVGSTLDMTYKAPTYIPVGNTVTLTAHITSDPSVAESVTLTIIPPPVTMKWTTGFVPPAQMAANGIQKVAADVTNDQANGVTWSVSCSNTAGTNPCGSFNSGNSANPGLSADGAAIVYTAPAAVPSGGVTITATSAYDITKSLSATIQIMPISVVVIASPSNTVSADTTATLTATVSWDEPSGGVNWSLSCSNTNGANPCGTITASGSCTAGTAPAYAATCAAIYKAPSLPSGDATLPVTVTATSIDAPASDPTQGGSLAITVGPPPAITVTLATENPSVQVNGTTTLTATVNNDYQNLGVNWSLPICGSGAAPEGCVTQGLCSQPGATASYTCATTYTAPSAIPSPDPVIVTASSMNCSNTPLSPQCAGNTKASASASEEIVPAISVVVYGPSGITAGAGASYYAIVTGDPTNSGVDWSCVGENCGTFSPPHTASGANAATTFTSPLKSPATSVVIKATSTASESAPPIFPGPFVSSGMPGSGDPVTLTVTPVSYAAFVPFAPSQLPVSNPSAQASSLVSLIAVSANDMTNEGVDWTVCATAATCGAFLLSPGAPATLSAGAIQPVYSAMIHAASGQAVSYLPPTQVPSTNNGAVTINVASHAAPTVNPAQAQITITANLTGTALRGYVMAGNLPVSGSTVQLYAASNSGYGGAASSLLSGNGVTTSSNGGFTIPAGYTCANQDTLLYLAATGGTVQGLSAPNAQLGLMTALGPCSNLNSAVPVVVNEVTTVATAWALAQFTGTGGTNFQNYQYIGSSGANYSNGLANAFATVNNLVDITTGQARSYTPGGGLITVPGPPGTLQAASGLVPQAEINTLADAIDTCAATTGGAPGDSSPCGAFFLAADVNPVGGIVSSNNAPQYILPAVLEVAAYPSKAGCAGDSCGGSVSSSGVPLYTLLPAQGNPFSPILSGPPSDWTLALTFTGGGLEGVKRAAPNSTEMAVDASGNLWIANRSISSVTELTNLGVALSPYASGFRNGDGGGFTGAGIVQPTQIAIDPYGNPWTLNGDGSLSEGTQASCTASYPNPFCGASSYPYAGGTGNTPASMAIDGIGNAWVADSGAPGDVAEYAGFYSCKGGAACVTGDTQVATGALIGDYSSLTDTTDTASLANPRTIGLDGKGNVWVLDKGNYAAVELSDANGTLELVDHGYQQFLNGLPVPGSAVLTASQWGYTMAFDKSGDIFIPDDVNGKQLYELFACGTGCTAGLAPSSPVGLGTIDPNGVDTPIAIDGAGNIWVMSNSYTYSAGNVSASIPSALVEMTASGGFVNSNSSNPNYGFVNPLSLNNSPTSIGVDASGNVWMLFDSSANVTLPSGETVDSGLLTEFVGVATPASNPLSIGKLGTKP